MPPKPVTVIFIGRSGSGKGTQAKLLMDALASKDVARSVFYVETGAKFREFFTSANDERVYSRELASKITAAGGLQPEFLTVWTWADLLLNGIRGNEHLVFDGTPRKIHEAQVLNSAVEFYGWQNPLVIHLDVDHTVAADRLVTRGRYDDQPEIIQKRMGWFETDVMPILDYYRGNPRYHVFDIDGGQGIEAVHQDIMKALARNTL